MELKKRFGLPAGKIAALAVILFGPVICRAQVTKFFVTPDADTFLRSAAPASNYGGAGAISVSGSAAVNDSGQQNGLFDSLIRFPATNIMAWANAALGSNSWMFSRVTLHMVELGAPANALFNRGVGSFEIRWIASDDWTEGTGTPNAPTTNGVAYGDLSSILNPNTDVSLGHFTNAGVDGPVSFDLALDPSFLSDLRSGGEVSLYLTAASADVGFTADSRSFGTASSRPSLEIAVTPVPALTLRFLTTNRVSVEFNSTSNMTYVLQVADTLAGTWSNLWATTAQPTNAHLTFADTATNQQRFYRVIVSP